MNLSMSTSERISRLSDKKKLLDILEGRLTPNIEDPDDVDGYVVNAIGYYDRNNEFLNKDLLNEVLDILKNEYGLGSGLISKEKSKNENDSKGKKTKNDDPKNEGGGKGEKSSKVKDNLETIKKLIEVLSGDKKKAFTEWVSQKYKDALIDILCEKEKKSTKSDTGEGSNTQEDSLDKDENKKDKSNPGEKNDKTNDDKSSEKNDKTKKGDKKSESTEKNDTQDDSKEDKNEKNADESKDKRKEGDGDNKDGAEKKQEDYTENLTGVFFSESTLVKTRKRGDKLDVNISMKIKVKGSCFVNEPVNIKFDNQVLEKVTVNDKGYIDCIVKLRDIIGMHNRDVIHLGFEIINSNYSERVSVNLNTKLPSKLSRMRGGLVNGSKRTYHKYFYEDAETKLNKHKKKIDMKNSLMNRRSQTIALKRINSSKNKDILKKKDEKKIIEESQKPLDDKIKGLDEELKLYEGYKRNLWKRAKKSGLSWRLSNLKAQRKANDEKIDKLDEQITKLEGKLDKVLGVRFRKWLNNGLNGKIEELKNQTPDLSKRELNNKGKFEKIDFEIERNKRVASILKF